MQSSTTNSSLSELIKNSVSTEFKHLYATLQSQNIQEGRAINSSTPETLCKEAAERVCNFILQSVQMEYTKERLSVLYEYEKQYLELIKDYKEEIKFSTNILEDIRKERASFFAETLKDVSNTLKETQVDDAVTSKWIESLVNSYSESLNLSQSLAEESVIKKFGEIKDKAKLTVDDDLIKDE